LNRFRQSLGETGQLVLFEGLFQFSFFKGLFPYRFSSGPDITHFGVFIKTIIHGLLISQKIQKMRIFGDGKPEVHLVDMFVIGRDKVSLAVEICGHYRRDLAVIVTINDRFALQVAL
jgi:hypothetical protein